LDNTYGDNTKAAASFYTGRGSAFINDEVRVTDNLTINYGIRGDYTKFLSTPFQDDYFNNNAIPTIQLYNYDLAGARSGQISDPKLSISPRLGFYL